MPSQGNVNSLPVRYFFCELETDLGLSNPSCSPEETRASRHQFTIRTLNKNLPKLVKYIIPSDKQWTSIWSAGYRVSHLPFANIDMANITDLVKTTCKVMLVDLSSLQERLTKVPPVISIFWAFTKRPAPKSWVCSSSTKTKNK